MRYFLVCVSAVVVYPQESCLQAAKGLPDGPFTLLLCPLVTDLIYCFYLFVLFFVYIYLYIHQSIDLPDCLSIYS